jgi:hypothetical protein
MDGNNSPQPQPAAQSSDTTEGQGKKGNSTLLIVGVVVVVLLIVGGIAAYFVMNALKDEVEETVAEELTEGLLESSTGGDVDVEIDEDNETYTWETDEGSATIGSAQEWPDEIPSDIPEFTYGDIISQFALEEDGQGGWNLGFEDVDSGAVSQYQSDFESDGWDIVSTMTSGTVEMFTAEKDAYTVSCSCNTDDDTCAVIVYTD